MAVTVVTTVGAADANSYCSLGEANAYHAGHSYSSVWDDAESDDVRNRALVTATRLLDEHVDWNGDVVSEDQALQWPRSGLYYKSKTVIPSNVIPQKLKDATAEFARQILEADRMKDMKQEAEGLESLDAAGVAMKFRNPRPKVIPDAVWVMIRSWGTIADRKGGVVSLVRA